MTYFVYVKQAAYIFWFIYYNCDTVIIYLKMCEMLEEARVKMLQNEIWLKCNIVSVSCVQDDLVRSFLCYKALYNVPF